MSGFAFCLRNCSVGINDEYCELLREFNDDTASHAAIFFESNAQLLEEESQLYTGEITSASSRCTPVMKTKIDWI